MVEEECKSVLIVNDSADAQITFYLYHRWDVICWWSPESIILKPGEKYLHSSKKGFQFKIVARFKDQRPKKTIVELQQWDKDKLFRVIDDQGTSSPTFIEEILTDQVEKRICLRKRQRDKELKKTRGQRNLYESLGLDMKKVREMSKEQQSEEIRSGFRAQIRRWHPDQNGGDEEVAKEILFAYEILQNEEKRSRYNNLADYDGGWLSAKCYKAIFKPDCVTEEQKRAYRKRLLLSVLSVVLLTGGIAATVATAGLATPALVALGAAYGGGLVGAGLLSLHHTVTAESVVDECRLKDWAMKAGIGFASVITGGAGAVIIARVTDIERTTLESAALEEVGCLRRSRHVPENVEPVLEEVGNRELETDEQPMDGKVKYISEGAWWSKMVVTFFIYAEMVTKEVTGSGTSIDIPSIARKIEVRFQVMRPFWGDVCKYDRFQKSWFKPYEPHIFRYDTPPIRTYTISGNLWWEAVMSVSDEYHDETREM